MYNSIDMGDPHWLANHLVDICMCFIHHYSCWKRGCLVLITVTSYHICFERRRSWFDTWTRHAIYTCRCKNVTINNILLHLRSPRDYVGSSVRSFVRSRLWYFPGPLDGASVREAHCEQASTAVREAHCEQGSTAVRRTEAPCAQASTAVRFGARSALRAGYCSAFRDI